MSRILVVNLTFNCPNVEILGPVTPSTIDYLNKILPSSTTSIRSTRKPPPTFQFFPNPERWVLNLDGQYCDKDGISRFMVILLDALEQEGDWSLTSSQATNMPNMGPLQQNYLECYKLFFVRGDD